MRFDDAGLVCEHRGLIRAEVANFANESGHGAVALAKFPLTDGRGPSGEPGVLKRNGACATPPP